MIKVGQVYEMTGNGWSTSNRGRLLIITEVTYKDISFRFIDNDSHILSGGWDIASFLDKFTLVIDV